MLDHTKESWNEKYKRSLSDKTFNLDDLDEDLESTGLLDAILKPAVLVDPTIRFEPEIKSDQPYVIMGLRFGPDDLPKPDPREGDVEEQKRLIKFWQDAWSNNEHPAYKAVQNKPKESDLLDIERYKDNSKSYKGYFYLNEAKRLRKKGILSEDSKLIYDSLFIRSKFSSVVSASEPVRTKGAHFIEDAMFLEWALKNNLAVYGIYFSEPASLYTLYSKMSVHSSSSWSFSCEAGWLKQDSKFNCIFALNCSGKPPLWTKDTRPAILHGTGILERRFNGSRDQAGEKNPIQWTSKFPDDNRNDLYYRSDTFKNLAGRVVKYCDIESLPFHLYSFWLSGKSRVFLKQTDAKRGVWLFDLPSQTAKGPEGKPLTPVDLFNLFLKAHEKDVERILSCYSRNGTVIFMIQECVLFENEYRFWVSDGRVMAGTPVRRDDTMLADNVWIEKCKKENNPNLWRTLGKGPEVGVKQGRFRPFLCKDRNSDGPHFDRKRISEYAKCARVIAAQLALDKKSMGRQFVLDLGTDARTGLILPIEVNSYNHAGCYGMPANMINKPLLDLALKAVSKQKLIDNHSTDKFALEQTYFWLGES